MEAVPRLPMISFELRQPDEPVDFNRKLKQYIKNHYNENPELFVDDIRQLEGLRSSAIHPTRDVAGCLTMKRYYCQLHFLSGRFPMTRDGAAAVKFSWKLFNNNGSTSMADIVFELSAILYNIGALHTQLGSEDSRTTPEGMKMSCTHFQCAAWAFQHLGEEYASSSGMDLTLDFLNFMTNVSLGQAQECILEKSMLDNRKASIIAKVTVQTIEYYKIALKVLADDLDEYIITDTVGSKLYRKWEKYLKFKISYLGSIAFLFQGQQAEEQQKMGERVAFYQASYDKLEEARKLSKSVDNIEAVNEALTFVHDVVEGKRKAAKNENEFVYHEEVPDLNLLPNVKGASLVKGIPFNINDPEVSGPDIFARIVPMKAHESSSLYSEEKAKLLRRIVGMIESKDEELETFMSTLQLDDLNKSYGGELPQELIDKCAELNAKPNAVKTLRENMAKLTEIYQDVEGMVHEIKRILAEEEKHEKEYQSTIGQRPPSIAATDLTRETKRYHEALVKAAESNHTLNKALILHLPYLKLLSSPLKEIASEIPEVVESPEVQVVSNEMRVLVDKVNEMKQQRMTFKEKLRESICQDDILKKLVTHNGENLQALFDSELQKHQPIVSIIEQNLAAQENIVKAMKDVYARYGTARRAIAVQKRKRDGMIASLMAAHDAYDDLMAMSSKGLEFFKKLQINVSKLLQRVRGTCMVQNEEREQIIKNVKGLEGHDVPPSTALKLKDFLEMRKELGKLSLGNRPSSSYSPFCKPSDQARKHTWIPGTRPTPLGSEGRDASKLDTFPALYQGRDQTWSSAPYSTNDDDKSKYYVPQTPAVAEARYPTENAPQSLPQDIYPISAYSSVMPNASTTGYTGPKSNYYNTENSPSRYINPPHFYTDHNQPVVSSYGTTQHPTNSSYSQQKSVTENVSSQPSAYASGGYSYPSQPVSSGYTSVTYSTAQPDVVSNAFVNTSHSGNYEYSGSVNVNKNPVQDTQPQYGAYGAGAVDPFSVSQQAYTQYTSNYNRGNISKLSSYAMGIKYNDAVQPQSTDYSPQQYVSPQTYPTQSGPGAYTISNDQPVPNYFIQTSSSDSNLPENYSTTNMSVMQSEFPYVPDNFTAQHFQAGTSQSNYNNTWQQASNSNTDISMSHSVNPSQALQSGNESLYTACQTNNYSVTSSQVYKNVDSPNQTAYTNQYYVNQYGSSNAQNQYGLNYGNSATYMQAGTDKQQATTTTTYSSKDSKSSPLSEHSNVDLLAGLDFNIGQSPLVPETPTRSDNSEVSVKTEKVSREEENKTVQETSNLNIKKEPFQETSVTKESCIDVEKLNQDVEKYEKFVESLTLKTLNGPTCLDIKWKEISDLQDKSTHLHIISVARCYPMKNRFPDILPYDDSRIELPSTKDDYINASLVKNLSSSCPNFILTQAPLPSTYADFWAMVFEQQVEVIVCLLNNAELDDQIYFPKEKGQELALGNLKISLQSSNVRPHWVERIMSVCVAETRVTRVVIHLQFTSWPGCSFPESPGPFLSFASESINFFNQQRSFSHPVVVHCTSGVGRSGLFCLIVTAIQDIQSGKGIPDLVAVTGQMCQYRKSPLRDREHLKFAYQAVLYYCQDLLMKRGFLTSRSAFDDRKLKEGKCHTRHPSEDFLLGPSTDVSQLQFGIQRFGFDCSGRKIEGETGANRSQSASSRRGSVTNSCASSGKTSPSSLSSEVLLTLDPANFNIKIDSNRPKKNAKKRYSTESFAKKSELSLEGFNTESEDPLSRLDPLWTMKK